MEKYNQNKIEESTVTGNNFSICIIEQVRESLSKDKIKLLLTKEQYNNCIKLTTSIFLKITKLKEKIVIIEKK